MASLSISTAPSERSIEPTVLLPLPMPPVSPMRRTGRCMAALDQAQPSQSSTRSEPASMTTMPAPARKGPKGT